MPKMLSQGQIRFHLRGSRAGQRKEGPSYKECILGRKRRVFVLELPGCLAAWRSREIPVHGSMQAPTV
jgi:hypothetical protein